MTKLLELDSASLANRELHPVPASASTVQRELLSQEPVRAMKLPMSAGPISIEVIGPEPNWFYPALDGLQRLGQLDVNWDSYGARRIDPTTAVEALRFMDQLFPGDGPTPAIVPTSSGGVQLEWHRADFELEIEFDGKGSVSGILVDRVGGREQEFDRPTPDLVAYWRARLTS